jgi:fluoroquinolone transport system permease protein
MNRIWATIRLDVRLQLRSKLYHIGIVVSVIMGVIIRVFFSSDDLGLIIPSFILLAIGGTTFMYGAGMVLLEKSERTLEALQASPLVTRDYLLSKASTLTAFAGIECLVVFLIVGPGGSPAPLPLIIGLATLGFGYTLFGLGMVAPHESVTTFLFPHALVAIGVLQATFFSIFDVGPALIYYLIPAQGPFLLMLGAYTPLATWQWSYAVVMTLAFLAGSYYFARERFRAHVRLQGRVAAGTAGSA